MSQDQQDGERSATIPRIALPEIPRASKEELERRRVLFERAMALRERTGPIPVSAADLVRQVRDEADGL